METVVHHNIFLRREADESYKILSEPIPKEN